MQTKPLAWFFSPRVGERTGLLLAEGAVSVPEECLGICGRRSGGKVHCSSPSPEELGQDLGGGGGFSRRDRKGFADLVSRRMCREAAVAGGHGWGLRGSSGVGCRGFCPAAAGASIQPLPPLAPRPFLIPQSHRTRFYSFILFSGIPVVLAGQKLAPEERRIGARRFLHRTYAHMCIYLMQR